MINKQELRIGNYVSGSGIPGASIIDVLDISNTTVIRPHRDDYVWPDQSYKYKCLSYESIFGIPLTEELILSLGTIENGEWKQEFKKQRNKNEEVLVSDFSADSDHDFAITVNLIHYKDNHFLCDIGNDSGDEMSLPFEPKFLHRLQNFYYALTGKELIFKP